MEASEYLSSIADGVYRSRPNFFVFQSIHHAALNADSVMIAVERLGCERLHFDPRYRFGELSGLVLVEVCAKLLVWLEITVSAARRCIMANILHMTILRYSQIVGGVDMMVSVLVSQLRRRHHVCVFVPGGWEQDRLVRRDAGEVPVYSLRLRLPNDGCRPWRGFFGGSWSSAGPS